MKTTRNILSLFLLAMVLTDVPNFRVEADESICVATWGGCAGSCTHTSAPSAASLCAEKCSHHYWDGNVITISDGCGNPGFACGTFETRITRSVNCKDYCDNDGCTPGHIRGSCPSGQTQTGTDGCGCLKCEADCGACTFDANGPGECSDDGGYYIEECGCCVDPWSPIVLSLDGLLRLSSPADGVDFDIDANGRLERISWPLDDSMVWLALDRNGNGNIDDGSELFGTATFLADGTRARNGYLALSELDTNGDRLITQADYTFGQLVVWGDTVRNGRVDPEELRPLSASNIRALSIDATESRRRDRWGNEFRYKALVRYTDGRVRFTWDVFLVRPTN